MAVHKKAIGTVGIMWSDMVSSQFMHALMQMLVYSQANLCKPGEFIHVNWARASYHELGRNQLVDEMEGDWLLQLDTDHVFGPDLLERLLFYKNREKASVISGIYCYKMPPYGPVANVWGPDGRVIPIGAWHPDTEVLQVGPVGGGCLLVDRKVFDAIKHGMNQAPFHIIPGLSEDYSFCKRCKDLNIPVHLAMKVESHHLAPRHVIYVSDYVNQFKAAFSAKSVEELKALK